MTAPIAHQTEMLVTESAGIWLLHGMDTNMVNHIAQLGALVGAEFAINCLVNPLGHRVNESVDPVQLLTRLVPGCFGLGLLGWGLW